MAATDAQIIEYARAFYGIDFAEKVAEALASTSWNFAAHTRATFQREIKEKEALAAELLRQGPR